MKNLRFILGLLASLVLLALAHGATADELVAPDAQEYMIVQPSELDACVMVGDLAPPSMTYLYRAYSPEVGITSTGLGYNASDQERTHPPMAYDNSEISTAIAYNYYPTFRPYAKLRHWYGVLPERQRYGLNMAYPVGYNRGRGVSRSHYRV